MTQPKTLGELKATGYVPRSVRREMRDNMITALRERRKVFDGIVGYQDTVIPQVINAVLAEHDLLLLGQRGQAKTRLIRRLTNLLDPEVPVIDGAPIHEDPLRPVTPTGRKLAREAGDDLPIAWLPRDARYNEKLATPDVSIADLIGDIDPIKAMSRKLDFDNEEIIHYGLAPRSNRCIFAINELPDLQPRIQVGLLNMLEEKDFQIRGFPIRMEVDMLMVFTANPEDYTNRGNIITPLKDRIESQIITHYPMTREEGVDIIKQESWQDRDGQTALEIGELFFTLVEQIAIEARISDYTDHNSGVSARMPISLLETALSSMERRALINGENHSTARICDLFNALPAITGKIELIYKGEQEGLAKVAEHLVGKAIKEVFNETYVPGYKHGRDPRHAFDEFEQITQWFEAGHTVDLDDTLPYSELEKRLNGITGLRKITQQGFPDATDRELVSAMELVLEGLTQNFVLSKFKLVNGTRYMDELTTMATNEEI